ncbi:hypothetical protein A262_11602 [Pseudomonas syringae pv. actinidiae ICMP 19073]|nr:hypothetical protein A262_11602 [Pseudomonas syringae pv. actinidiae ICMP 19073]
MLARIDAINPGRKSDDCRSRLFRMQIVTPKLINDFKLMRLQTVKAATCRHQLAFLSRFFKYAKRGLLIDIPNPVCDITLPKPDKSSDKVVTAGELRLILNELSPTMP